MRNSRSQIMSFLNACYYCSYNARVPETQEVRPGMMAKIRYRIALQEFA